MNRNFKSEPVSRYRLEASMTRSESFTVIFEGPLDRHVHGTPPIDNAPAVPAGPQLPRIARQLSSVSPRKLSKGK